MIRFALTPLLIFAACRGDEGPRRYCGTQSFDGVQLIDGDLLDVGSQGVACWDVTEDDSGVRIDRRLPGEGGLPDGGCHLEAPSRSGPFTGDCHQWMGSDQVQQHVIEGESSVLLDDETLTLDLRIWTTTWTGTRLYTGSGTISTQASFEEVQEAGLEWDLLPACFPASDCVEGVFQLVEVSGPAACQQAVDAQEGQPVRVSRLSANRVVLDGNAIGAHPDLVTCATYFTDDGDPFSTFTYTLEEDGYLGVTQFEQWSLAPGNIVRCDIEWAVPTSACP